MIEMRSEVHCACCLSAWSGVEGGGACFNAERTKRFMLWRIWDEKLPLMAAIMLNPSIADEQQLDPTLRRVYGYAKQWGFGGMVILNCFAVVATSPKQLDTLADLNDGENDAHIITAIRAASVERVMVGWGANLSRKALAPRRTVIDAILADHAGDKAMAWRISSGQPGHPLYLASNIEPIPYHGASK